MTTAVRPGGPTSGGGPALRPSTVDELAEQLAATREPVRARGAGTKLGWLAPADLSRQPAVELDTRGLGSVLEHSPQDLVVQAEAGVALADLQQQLAAEGQRLALDPPEPGATLGGIVAANASGPRRHRFGTVRDLLLGVTVVLANGTVARSGGKVVKNVAGYDLAKLMTGSFGTLAVVVETIWRLHPLPPAQRVVVAEADDAVGLAHLVGLVRRAPQTPSAVEVQAVAGQGGRLVLLVEGLEESVQAQASGLAGLLQGSTRDTLPDTMPGGFGARPWAADPCRVGLSVAVSPGGVGRALAALPAGSTVGGRVATGVLELAVDPASLDLARLRALVADDDGTVVVRQAAAGVGHQGEAAALDVWGPIGGGASSPLELMRRVKLSFDPDQGLEPGRFVGGI